MGNKQNSQDLSKYELGDDLENQIKQAFQRFDLDGNGSVEQHEITK